MSDFNFTATAECDYCGNLLSSSEESCGECSDDVNQHIFRRIGTSSKEPQTIMVEATMDYKWQKLKRELGEDWIAYEWLGPRPSVQTMVGTRMWDSIQDIPERQSSLDAPKDL